MTTTLIPNYVVGTWTIDPVHTEIGFVARHLMVTKVRGKFEKYTASITTAENPLDSRFEVEVDLSSITTGNDQRDDHLRSADFFDADNNPKMTFRSTAIRPAGDDYEVDGELTIRGITKLVTLKLEFGGIGPDPWGGTRLGVSLGGVINRHDFGVSFNAVIEGGGVVVSDKVTIAIEAEAVLDQPAQP
jgi:polyisoprenoid-binding protein YceI